MQVPADSALFVGDDLVNDYEGASAAGLHAVWLNRSGEGGESGCPEILSLSEVPRVIRLLSRRTRYIGFKGPISHRANPASRSASQGTPPRRAADP